MLTNKSKLFICLYVHKGKCIYDMHASYQFGVKIHTNMKGRGKCIHLRYKECFSEGKTRTVVAVLKMRIKKCQMNGNWAQQEKLKRDSGTG